MKATTYYRLGGLMLVLFIYAHASKAQQPADDGSYRDSLTATPLHLLPPAGTPADFMPVRRAREFASNMPVRRDPPGFSSRMPVAGLRPALRLKSLPEGRGTEGGLQFRFPAAPAEPAHQ
ncbi:hypothetical protein [Pedobacter sp. SYP-B3415]|uniref:hypothetical protein n=1 Tax=Pedobacter sp. SYP-B3415 TaxID=2496641 RepID=UPI00101B9897|nr:hypothetical protein [Pedobacter sp. SYP-B3415]